MEGSAVPAYGGNLCRGPGAGGAHTRGGPEDCGLCPGAHGPDIFGDTSYVPRVHVSFPATSDGLQHLRYVETFCLPWRRIVLSTIVGLAETSLKCEADVVDSGGGGVEGTG
jgi:hypothetical protein